MRKNIVLIEIPKFSIILLLCRYVEKINSVIRLRAYRYSIITKAVLLFKLDKNELRATAIEALPKVRLESKEHARKVK
jgi:hypothetical protein